MFSRRWDDLERRIRELETQLAATAGLAARVTELQREIDNFRLDYQSLYERVRVNLSKLRKRSETADGDGGVPDPLLEARKALVARKLRT